MTNKDGQHRENRQEVDDTSRIREFLRMNPQSFKGSSVTRIHKILLKSFRRFLKSCMFFMLRG
ncbi:hypothetical protein MTR67_052065 [Solanum verrucosum]|uniref:Uncharacterized protein n=1 Tax=Solanum verrucosum TaxID=315347 RepID=A0AAF0V6A3_SOLVR|nr:hypothetical protein MTR67_052065 [Solanum verrucosum]